MGLEATASYHCIRPDVRHACLFAPPELPARLPGWAGRHHVHGRGLRVEHDFRLATPLSVSGIAGQLTWPAGSPGMQVPLCHRETQQPGVDAKR